MLTDFFANRPGGNAVFAIIRLLAVLDAIFVQCLGLRWVYGWPDHGGVIGMVAATVLIIWALKRAGHALFSFDTYTWMVFKLGKWVALLWGVAAIMGLWSLIARH